MPSAAPLDQDDLRRWRACPRHHWLHRQQGEAQAARAPGHLEEGVVQGAATDQALRSSFPLALSVPAPNSPDAWEAAIEKTRQALTDGYLSGQALDDGHALFGACLRSNDGAQAHIDVLAPGQYGLRIFKVRYATVGDDGDVDAVAWWAHVAARCGLRVQSVGLLLVDTDFVYPGLGCYAGLFREVDLSPVLGSRPVPDWIVAMRACERGAEPALPAEPPCLKRHPCAHMAHCAIQSDDKKLPRPSSLEVVGRDLAQALREEGHADLMSVPQQRLPDARRRRALRAIQHGAPELDSTAALLIRQWTWPRHTLRFDTIGFATPIWPGTRPYQILPFQWACDVEAAPGELVRHSFLAVRQADPRRAFAESLIHVLGSTGPILAYNAGFERNRLRELATQFEDLAPALDALQPRIVDLFQLARAHYYHPTMCGSWSFKSLSNAVAPDLHADAFDWAGEHEAQVAFARSVLGQINASQLDGLREALIAYGQRQTEALRHLVALFEGADLGQRLQLPV